MNTKNPPKKSSPDKRNQVIKTHLNVDEYLSLRDKCAAVGVAVGAHVRALINRDLQHAHRSADRRRGERPAAGPLRARFPAVRGHFGAPVPRLRL